MYLPEINKNGKNYSLWLWIMESDLVQFIVQCTTCKVHSEHSPHMHCKRNSSFDMILVKMKTYQLAQIVCDLLLNISFINCYLEMQNEGTVCLFVCICVQQQCFSTVIIGIFPVAAFNVFAKHSTCHNHQQKTFCYFDCGRK